MKKLIGLSFLAAMLAFGVRTSEAASPTRGAKPSIQVGYTTSIATVTARSGVLYSVIMGTGAVNEFVAIFDTASANISPINSGNIASSTGFKTRLYNIGNASGTYVVNLDPPLQFYNGIVAAPSSANNGYLFVFESGRVVNGY